MTLVRTNAEFSLKSLIHRLIASSDILESINDLPGVVEAAKTAEASEAIELLAPLARDESDGLLSRIAIRALSQVASTRADEVLTQLLHRGYDVAAHAAWAFSSRRPYVQALAPLVDLAGRGGFARMMSELAIETWMRELPEIAWRPEMKELGRRLGRPSENVPPGRRRGDGLRIAQIVMQGRVDTDLSWAAKGDGGGLVTLQVGLAAELARHTSVSEVYLITRLIRGEAERLGQLSETIGDKGTLARLDFGPEGYLAAAEMWAHRADLERELRRFFQTHGPFDALHLRFLDVGTFVAARLAKELGIPVYFTLAPDPHSLISSWQASGALTRGNFAEFDAQQHLVFRAWLLQELLEEAERLVMLPRRRQRQEFLDLFALDIDDEPRRFVSIPEGVDLSKTSEAGRIVGLSASAGNTPSVIQELQTHLRSLPEARQGLPLILSVGRMHPVKGFDRLVSAWNRQAILRDSFNLVIVGGDLAAPSPVESAALGKIAAAQHGDGACGEGLILLEGRSHSDVALLMAATRKGFGDLIGKSGIYVAASEKEEFGLAVVEAMAAGLPVVAPVVGGPGMYVDHEVTGFLADTTDIDRLAEGIMWAAENRSSEVRAVLAAQKVREAYSLSAMANHLVDLYTAEGVSTAAS